MDIVGISQKEQVFLLHEHEFSFFLARKYKIYPRGSYLSTSCRFSVRKQFSELLLRFFILGILSLQKARMLIHQFQKMIKPSST